MRRITKPLIYQLTGQTVRILISLIGKEQKSKENLVYGGMEWNLT